jgi:single-stranded-DNA-specific exonuclease
MKPSRRRCEQLALQLDSENVKRQDEEAEILAQAKKIVTTDPEVGARSILVVAGEGWHRGVIGIVASKLQDAFHRPAIVLSVEDGTPRSCAASRVSTCSARSSAALHLMTRFGGHKQAASASRWTPADSRAASCRQRRRRRNAGPRRSDAAAAHRRRPCVPRDYRGVAAAHHVAGAVGARHNPRPVFAARGVEIIDGPRKLKERHLKMSLKQEGRIFRAVAWRAAERHDFLGEHRAARCGVLARTEPA